MEDERRWIAGMEGGWNRLKNCTQPWELVLTVPNFRFPAFAKVD
jgi:hypothetical protein